MSQTETLNLDEPLMLLALQEASQILGEIQHQVRGPLLDQVCAAQLRLTYYLLRCPALHLERVQVLALHRLSQERLASRLQDLGRYQDRLHQSAHGHPGSLDPSRYHE